MEVSILLRLAAVWLNEVWNWLLRLAHSHAVFDCKDFCGSTALGRCAQRLKELSEHEQARASQHWSKGKRSGERKWLTFPPPSCGTICVQPDRHWHGFNGSLGETAEKRVGARMGFSERYAILSRNWNWAGVMNLILILSYPFGIQHREPYCCHFF